MKTITLWRYYGDDHDERILRVELDPSTRYAFATSVEYINRSIAASTGKTWMAGFNSLTQAEKSLQDAADFLVEHNWVVMTEVSA